mmetsp:Transcript_68175/g.176934  ORF Transcript_68175/g.176934 Transcript_68175/m.176934 type:complete len:200 (-) Transcript_68175:93-692(-)
MGQFSRGVFVPTSVAASLLVLAAFFGAAFLHAFVGNIARRPATCHRRSLAVLPLPADVAARRAAVVARKAVQEPIDMDMEDELLREMQANGDIPEAVIHEWDQDEIVREIMVNFQSPELEGKDTLSFRDVYKLLEYVGVDRQEFIYMFSDPENFDDYDDDDEDFDGEFDDDFDDDYDMSPAPALRGGGSQGGKGNFKKR